MANKTDTTAQGTLQRGKACLRCRKRKMRCDGQKPACQQCVRAKKGDGCEYDDGKGKTRTQILKETIVRLEHRIRELEDPEYIPPAVNLYDPHFHHQSESSSSSLGSPGGNPSHSPFTDFTSSPQASWASLPHGLTHTVTPPPPSFSPELFLEGTSSQYSQPLYELGPVLLDIFEHHQYQCGLNLHMGHLKASLNGPISDQRHPSLMNAIYLWACFFSRPDSLCQHEEHYLKQALNAHRDGLQTGDKVVDMVQASCLLSLYFLVNGRVIEGSYHCSAAAALAVQCGLHSSASHDAMSWISESYEIKPPKDDYRAGEKILTFWQVYNMDRCWSVALHKPPVIPDGPDMWNAIDCPWPQDMADYEAGHFSTASPFPTVQSFLNGDISPSGFSTHALRAKASAVFSRAQLLSGRWDSRTRIELSANLQEEIQSLEVTITRFLQTLIPVQQLDTSPLIVDKHILLVTHTLAHAAIIHLYERLAQDDHIAYDKCHRASSAIASIVKHISEQDYDFLDPIIGPCWTSASTILMRNIRTFEASFHLLGSSDVRSDVAAILYAMNTLSRRFPILGISASKLQKELSASSLRC